MAKQIDTSNVDTVKCLTFAKEFMGGQEYKIFPASKWLELTVAEQYTFCAATGIYVIPTQELIDKLSELISEDEDAIEVCCGLGIIGRELCMPTTDSKIQESAGFQSVMSSFDTMNMLRQQATSGRQPIKYPEWVEKFEALEAVEHFKPNCVLVCYGTPKFSEDLYYKRLAKGKETHGFIDGVDYEELIKKVPHVVAVSTPELMQNTICVTKEWCNRHDVKLVVHKAVGCFSSTRTPITIFEWKKKNPQKSSL